MLLRRRGPRRTTVTAATVALLGLSLPSGPAHAAGLAVTDLTGSLTAADLAHVLAGEGVSIDNVSYSGAPTSAGRFTGGGTGSDAVVGFDSGVVLSTGSADVGGATRATDATGSASRAGDAELDALGAGATRDTTSLTFDVTPDRDRLYFNYVFASEEYNEYVYRGVSDVFGFFVSRPGDSSPQNCAVVGDGPDSGSAPDPVTVDTVNGGNPFGDANASNPELFRDNALAEGAPLPAEPDGFTVVLQCVASVTPHQVNRLHLAIGDVGDSLLDSWVFLQAGSITTSREICGNGVDDDGDGVVDGDCAAAAPTGSDEQEVGGRVTEGAPASLRGTATSPEGHPLTTRWSYSPGLGVDPGATCTFADPASLTTTVTCTDDGRFALTLSARDGDLAPVSSTTVLEVDNVAPRVSIQPAGTGSVGALGLRVAASVSDPGANDARTCTILWGDRTTSPGSWENGTCSGRHSYALPGTYSVKVRATDDDGQSGSDRVTVVVTGSDGAGGDAFVLGNGAGSP
jgi:hypothetical protein